MQALKNAYALFCRIEQALVALLIVAITLLIFGSAVARTLGHPVNITTDLALLMFAWVVFIGADVSLQQADFLRVEILLKTFPLKLQKILYYIFSVAAIVVLALIVNLGVPLALDNSARLFQTLGISYAWATMSAPVGCALMIVTIVLKMVKHWRDEEIVLVQSEAI
ncbi:ABC transporter substrate-binding protein [Brachybacterium avium]|uniref:ABC transporter substrate-binding protein n=1 Tax=Brachybacterium avium TaxID=2017485 RepID=A0A220UE15_9MICO|nr:TRAP transporter small permease subunit [Brachybacterium avium]ASK66230.1 ABC transporter substrate-binding protein [Brachybacterium avium]